jgi:hypothetical protein
LLGRGDARVVMADPVARMIGSELVHDRPRHISLLPEARDSRAIGAEVPKAGNRCRLTGDEADLHDGVLKCLVPFEPRPGEPGCWMVVYAACGPGAVGVRCPRRPHWLPLNHPPRKSPSGAD